MKKKNILQIIRLVLLLFSVVFLLMSCGDANLNKLLNLNTQEKIDLIHANQDKEDGDKRRY